MTLCNYQFGFAGVRLVRGVPGSGRGAARHEAAGAVRGVRPPGRVQDRRPGELPPHLHPRQAPGRDPGDLRQDLLRQGGGNHQDDGQLSHHGHLQTGELGSHTE